MSNCYLSMHFELVISPYYGEIMIVSTLLLLVTVLLYWKLYHKDSYWDRKNVVRYKSWPLVGSFGPVLFGRMSFMELLDEMYRYFPNERYFGMYNCLKPGLVLKDLDLIKRITIKEFHNFPEHRSVVPEQVDLLLSKSILFMKGGKKWQKLRSALSPAFTSRKLKTMYPLMIRCAKQFVSYYQNEDGILALEMKGTFSKYTNDVIASTTFGFECNSFNDPDNEFYIMGRSLITSVSLAFVNLLVHSISPLLTKILNIRLLPNDVVQFFSTLIDEAIEQRANQHISRPDLIQLLTKVHKHSRNVAQKDLQPVDITKEDLTAQVAIFYLAGMDTSSNCLAFAAYELATNSKIQQTLFEEIATLSDIPSYDDLLHLQYLDMVVSETLRKWPPITFVDRKSAGPFVIKSGNRTIQLDANTDCFIPIRAIQMDAKYHPEPEKFDPERFSGNRRHLIRPFSYIPFGVGPKSCIGSRFALVEVKLMLVVLLSQYEIVPVTKTTIPVVISKRSFFPESEGGMWLGLKKRKSGDRKLW